MGGKKEEKADKSIEESLAQLEGILEILENGDISLEESFGYYESGMKLVKECGERIDKVEKQIQVLSDAYEAEEED